MKTWAEISYQLGRNDLPWALDWAICEKQLTDLNEIAQGIEDAWTGPDGPMNYLRKIDWAHYFSMVGFLHNTVRTSAPTEPITVYRGSTRSRRFRWSWTEDREQAEWFTTRLTNAGIEAHLWTAEIPAGKAMARFDAARSEAEWVFDPVGTRVRLATQT